MAQDDLTVEQRLQALEENEQRAWRYALDGAQLTDAPTLRDQLAMAALTGLILGRQDAVGEFAKEAYLLADAMLDARKVNARDNSTSRHCIGQWDCPVTGKWVRAFADGTFGVPDFDGWLRDHPQAVYTLQAK